MSTGDLMQHYLFIEDHEANEVLGVWQVKDAKKVERVRLELSLTYPGYKTVARAATSFEALKTELNQYDFGLLQPEPA